MLTLKMIMEQTDKVIAGLEKKHFKNAKETIAEVLELNSKRRSTQNILDKNLSEVNQLSRSIGALMKEGKKEEAEAAKKHVAEIKESNKSLQAEMDKATSVPLYPARCCLPFRMCRMTRCRKGMAQKTIWLSKWGEWKQNFQRMRYPTGSWRKSTI
mgnify:CR=1 FL=1